MTPEEHYNKATTKNLLLSKKILFCIFFILGIMFLIASAFLYIFSDSIPCDDGDPLIAALVFAIIGGSFVIVSILVKLLVPKKFDYKRYKRLIHSYGRIDIYELSATVEQNSEKLKELDKLKSELDEAKSKIDSLERMIKYYQKSDNSI